MHPLLSAAITDLYRASQAQAPLEVDACPCCASNEQLVTLLEVPLRELTAAQLSFYGSRAISTVGSIDDFRYFWPRLAELAAAETSTSHLYPEILFGKVAEANWRGWPTQEQRATESYGAALIVRMRDDAFDARDVDQWVCAVGQFIEDVTPLLDEALLGSGAAARQNLFGLYDWNRRSIEKHGSLHNRFWVASSRSGQKVINPNVGKIVAWFRRPDVAAAVDQAYAEHFARGEAAGD